MPSIMQLPLAATCGPDDELPVAQGSITRSVSVSTLLGNLQPLLQLSTGTLLGRTSVGDGSVELLTGGSGISIGAGSVGATGGDHANFAVQPVLTPTDDVILNSAGLPRRLQLGLMRGLFSAGTQIAIDNSGVISASVSVFHAASGAPQISGKNGDQYLDAASGEIWQNQQGSWIDSGQNILAAERNARISALAPLISLRASSNGTVPAILTLDGTAASAALTLVMPNVRCVCRMTGTVTAQDTSSGDAIVWDFAAALRRSTAGSVPVLLRTPSTAILAGDPSMNGCGLNISAGPNGGIIQGTGLSGQGLNWAATLLVVDGI
jgi:hypothetical protein